MSNYINLEQENPTLRGTPIDTLGLGDVRVHVSEADAARAHYAQNCDGLVRVVTKSFGTFRGHVLRIEDNFVTVAGEFYS